MDFIDELRQFSTRVSKIKDAIQKEEATKNSLVLPFFQLLGYDVFNPLEFVPEYEADFGVKKDARVDYAIVIDGTLLILVECKPCTESLEKHSGQLFQYFAATPAKFGILTNGISYRFFTDLNEPNKMDAEPFLVFDLLDINENIVPELRRFARKTLDISGAFSAASELKYMNKIKELLNTLRTNPSDSFVKHVMSELDAGRATSKAIDEFRPILKRGFVQYINDSINERLKTAMREQSEDSRADVILGPDDEIDKQGDIDASPMSIEEMEAFAIVKSILRDMIDVDRLTWQHTKEYMVILFDGNNRKRICRFWFNREQKFITTPDENKKPVRRDISGLNDIYKYAEFIREVCARYI